MSKIEWTDRSDWNLMRGCTRASEGCRNCYAETIAARFSDPGQPFHSFAERTANGPRWTGKVALIEERLTFPLRWRKPARVFVNSAFDLFHESVPDAWIDRVFAVMARAPQHTFQLLTKRSKRMRAYMNDPATPGRIYAAMADLPGAEKVGVVEIKSAYDRLMNWPLPNVWLGVSAEDQARADERIPDLLATPAAVRFVSAEPMLGRIDFAALRQYNPSGAPWIDALRGLVTRGDYLARSPSEGCFNTRTQVTPPELPRLDWIIVGSESGSGARPLRTPHVRSIVEQCRSAGVACFVKQLGANAQDRNDAGFDGENYDGLPQTKDWPTGTADRIEHDLDGTRDGYQGAPVRIRLRDRKGGDPVEWPEDLRVQQLPWAVSK